MPERTTRRPATEPMPSQFSGAAGRGSAHASFDSVFNVRGRPAAEPFPNERSSRQRPGYTRTLVEALDSLSLFLLDDRTPDRSANLYVDSPARRRQGG